MKNKLIQLKYSIINWALERLSRKGYIPINLPPTEINNPEEFKYSNILHTNSTLSLDILPRKYVSINTNKGTEIMFRGEYMNNIIIIGMY